MSFKKPVTEEYHQIFQLLNRAFAPSIAESEIVRRLRDAGKIALDLIFEKNGRVLAYICYSTAYDSQKRKIGYHLAPLAVLPEKQRQALGKQIVRESLKALGRDYPIYVLGDPEYYGKFGFSIDKTQKCPFDPDGAHFMVLFDRPLDPQEVFYEDEFMD